MVKKPRKSDIRPHLYIYERPRYFVRVKGKQIGEYHTLDEAQIARDTHLTTLARKP